MIKILFFVGCLIIAEEALAKEVYLLGKVLQCTVASQVQCNIGVKKTEFQAKGSQISGMQLASLTADKTLVMPVNKYSLQVTKHTIEFQLVGKTSSKSDAVRATKVLIKNQIVILTFKNSDEKLQVQMQPKRKNDTYQASSSPKSNTVVFKKKTKRTAAKKGHVLHESVNQLSPERESVAPAVEYGGPSTFADIEYAH